ncbi:MULTISPECIES: phosphotransferase enzyme family protein [unclassified Nocardiopsis]|uniref:phosphotransferase enzyme family protein n=1 Tax=unclassified Nocardiopsis TaxID=2649073 RepID=UPI0013593581|nr:MULTISPECIES: aminoglycoside phosphotransferase family protein [unclassified Nocardiopsis]
MDTETFDATSSLKTLHLACTAVGLPVKQEPELIRLGENAVWRLPEHHLVARVARSIDRFSMADRGVQLARWMHHHQVPAVLPVDQITNPVRTEDNRVVTWWIEVRHHKPATPAQLGAALRALHDMPLPDPHLINLPEASTVDKIDQRLATVILAEHDRDFLQNMAARLHREYADLTYDLARGLVHGDAHAANLLVTPDKQLGWVDLDGVALGQPEWDLVLTPIERDCGWVAPEAYQEFVDAYGYDVTTSPAYPVLREIRLLRMTSWLAQLPGAQARSEVDRRIRDLRERAPIRGWRAF